jgi:hypothetical protein
MGLESRRTDREVEDMAHGFKFYKSLDERNPLRRFWWLYVSDAFSGEIHGEKVERERVFEILVGRGIRIG